MFMKTMSNLAFHTVQYVFCLGRNSNYRLKYISVCIALWCGRSDQISLWSDVSGVCAGDYGVTFLQQICLCAIHSLLLWNEFPLLKSMGLSMIAGSTADALSPIHLSCTLRIQLVFVSSFRSIQTLQDNREREKEQEREPGRGGLRL